MPRHKFTDTRQRIEEAAMGLFVEKGVTETTIRDIARAVDISEGALYRHFTSKEDLVWRVFEERYIAFAHELEQLAAAESSGRGQVSAMIRGFCRAHDENPTLFRFLLFVQHGQLNRLAADALTPVEAMRRVLARAIAQGELPEQNVELATALVFGVVLQPVTFSAYGRLPRELAPICERLVRAAWAAVAAV